jgi:hypothetical protein
VVAVIVIAGLTLGLFFLGYLLLGRIFRVLVPDVVVHVLDTLTIAQFRLSTE